LGNPKSSGRGEITSWDRVIITFVVLSSVLMILVQYYMNGGI
jgi:hypothetical protein